MIRGREHVQNILTGNQLSLKNSNHSKKPLETIRKLNQNLILISFKYQ